MARHRERDLFRVSPVHALELLIGKYLAYGLLTFVIAAGLVALLAGALGVPFVGERLRFARLVLLLGFAPLGLGLLISLVSDSERQPFSSRCWPCSRRCSSAGSCCRWRSSVIPCGGSRT